MPDLSTRGGQGCLRTAIERHPDVVLRALRRPSGRAATDTIEWRSPVRATGFKRYRDAAALKLVVGQKLRHQSPKQFSPARGPVGDALGVVSSGWPIFIEAKADIAEAVLPVYQGSPESLKLISKSMEETRKFYAPNASGGPLGCELAQASCRLGSRVTIVQDTPLFLPKEEREAVQLLSDAFARDGIEIHLNTTATAVRMEGRQKLVDLVSAGQQSTLAADEILTGIGRVPNVHGFGLDLAGVECDAASGIHVNDFLQTTNSRIYAAGDACLDCRFTHTAVGSARIVVRNALFPGPKRWSALTIPWCTYTDPEVVHVGMYVREAREKDIPIRTFTIPMHDVPRATADGEEHGFVKIHVREGTDTILGATVVARRREK